MRLFPLDDPCALGDAGSLCKEETAAAPRQSEHGFRRGTPAGARHWPLDGGENPPGSKILRRIQERGRPAGDSGHRAKEARQDAEIPDRWQSPAEQEARRAGRRITENPPSEEIFHKTIGRSKSATTGRERRERTLISTLARRRQQKTQDAGLKAIATWKKEERKARGWKPPGSEPGAFSAFDVGPHWPARNPRCWLESQRYMDVGQ